MSSLFLLGINPGDSKMLMEYEEIGWFIDDVKRQKDNKEIYDLIQFAESFRMANIGLHKSGIKDYNNWRNSLLDNIKQRPEDIPQETLFESIKNTSKIEVKTLFDKIKQRVRGK